MSYGKQLRESIFSIEITQIKIAGEDVPVKFGISALAEVDAKYGSLAIYEENLKNIMPKEELAKEMVNKQTPLIFQAVQDGIIAMIHCGCRSRGYDLTGVTDDELLGAIEMNFFDLRKLVIAEFDKQFSDLPIKK